VNPFGQVPIVVQSIAQNLSPSGDLKHSSEGLLQSLLPEHWVHC
jgi:hypothetical protein